MPVAVRTVPITPSVLTYEQLWASWTPSTPATSQAKSGATIATINAAKDATDDTLDGISALKLKYHEVVVRTNIQTRLDIYKDIVEFYARENKGERFERLWKELKSPGMRQFDLKIRCKRAEEGKAAASTKYKDGNWMGALYTYAIAWGCLVPYFPESLEAKDPLRKEMNKLEMALFSNIAAMSLSALDDSEHAVPVAKIPEVLHLGLRACAYVISRRDIVTVGIMQKSCRRAADLAEKLLANFHITAATPSQIAFWKKQEEALKGVQADKLYKDVPKEQQVETQDEDLESVLPLEKKGGQK